MKKIITRIEDRIEEYNTGDMVYTENGNRLNRRTLEDDTEDRSHPE